MATTPDGSGQVPAELHRVAVDVDGGEVGALRADHVETLGREATAELVALVLKARRGSRRNAAAAWRGRVRWPAGTARRSHT